MIPKIPEGCTLRSLINALLYLRGNLCLSRNSHTCLWGAHQVALELFGGQRTASWAAMQFTALPLVISTLSEDQKQTLLSKLFDQEPIAKLADDLKAMLPRAVTTFRVCRLCVEEDVSKYGLAFTRVLHQIPSIRTCSAHGSRLENACGDCGHEYRLTGANVRRRCLERCSLCQSAIGRPVDHVHSAGYAAFSDLLHRGLVGQAPEVRPDQLSFALQRFVELSVRHGEDLLWMFAKFWNVDSWRVACQRLGADPAEIRRSLLFGIPPESIVGVYGLASFFHSYVITAPDLPTGAPVDAPIWSFMRFKKQDELVFDWALLSGMPTEIALLLIQGDWVAIRNRGVSLRTVRRFIESLDAQKSLILKMRRMHLRRLSRLQGGSECDRPNATAIAHLASVHGSGGPSPDTFRCIQHQHRS